MEPSDGASGGASASARLADAARRAFEAGDFAEARRALSDPSLESAVVASGDRHRLAHARAVLEFHDGGGSVDELLERLRLAEADARDSAAARAASSSEARADADVDGDADVDVDADAATRAATHAESDAFHDAYALRANLAWALQASGRAAASAEVLEDLFREIDAVDPSAAFRVCAMLVRAARRTGRLDRAARVLDRAESILRRVEPILRPRPRDATDATETPASDTEKERNVHPTGGADAEPDGRAGNAPPDGLERRTSSIVFDPVATRAWISLERARLALLSGEKFDDVSARLDALDEFLDESLDHPRRLFLQRGDERTFVAPPEKKRASFAVAAESRVLRAAAAASSGRAEAAMDLLMDADETGTGAYLSSASGCANLAEAFRRSGRPAAATALSKIAVAQSTTPEAREDALAEAALAALTEGRHDDAEAAFEALAWKTRPETWLRLAECAAARGTKAALVSAAEENDASSAVSTSSAAFERACRCLDVADALFSARSSSSLPGVDGEQSVYPSSARAGIAANRAYANLRLGRPRAALAHAETLARLVGGWDADVPDGDVPDVVEECLDGDFSFSSRNAFRGSRTCKVSALHSNDLTPRERREYRRVGRCYAAEALFALGRFDESWRTTRDAAHRDDADFETITHAARAAYALEDAEGAERLTKRAREAAPDAAEPRLMAAFLRLAGGDPAAAAATLAEGGERRGGDANVID